ncbi:MAG: hypothetical protein Q8L14_23395 [Myxococcales bacterium]|nr:hypothetical protein [Myxococcales bacterium]
MLTATLAHELTPPLALVAAVQAAEWELLAAQERRARAERLADARRLRDELEGELAELKDSVRWLHAERRALAAHASKSRVARVFPWACGLGAVVGLVLVLWVR